MSSDAEAPAVYGEQKVRARKPHICCECHGAILVGEHYFTFSGCWDGKWDRFKTCTDCQALRDEINRASDGVLAFGEVYQYVFEREEMGWIDPYMRIRQKRNAPPSMKNWMEEVWLRHQPDQR